MSAEELLEVSRLEAEVSRLRQRNEALGAALTLVVAALEEERRQLTTMRQQLEDASLAMLKLDQHLADAQARVMRSRPAS